MSDGKEIVDKAKKVKKGFEKKAKEVLDDLIEAGEGENVENKIIDKSVNIVSEIADTLHKAKDKIDTGIMESLDTLLDKLNVAQNTDIEDVKAIAVKARKKIDKLEKRLEKLEKESQGKNN